MALLIASTKYLRSDIQMIDREASPCEAATTEGERDAGDDGRATLNHQRRQRHEAGLADVRSASEQLADLLRERRQ